MDYAEGAVEVHLNRGDALLFVDGITHGASSRTNPGERRVVIYRCGVSWGANAHAYAVSAELLAARHFDPAPHSTAHNAAPSLIAAHFVELKPWPCGSIYAGPSYLICNQAAVDFLVCSSRSMRQILR